MPPYSGGVFKRRTAISRGALLLEVNMVFMFNIYANAVFAPLRQHLETLPFLDCGALASRHMHLKSKPKIKEEERTDC